MREAARFGGWCRDSASFAIGYLLFFASCLICPTFAFQASFAIGYLLFFANWVVIHVLYFQGRIADAARALRDWVLRTVKRGRELTIKAIELDKEEIMLERSLPSSASTSADN